MGQPAVGYVGEVPRRPHDSVRRPTPQRNRATGHASWIEGFASLGAPCCAPLRDRPRHGAGDGRCRDPAPRIGACASRAGVAPYSSWRGSSMRTEGLLVLTTRTMQPVAAPPMSLFGSAGEANSNHARSPGGDTPHSEMGAVTDRFVDRAQHLGRVRSHPLRDGPAVDGVDMEVRGWRNGDVASVTFGS